MLGAGIGYGGEFSHASGNSQNANILQNVGLDFLLGGKWFFGKSGVFGMRFYLNYAPRFWDNYNAHDIALNYDLMLNFVRTRGFKFGIAFGIITGASVWQETESQADYGYTYNGTNIDLYYTREPQTSTNFGILFGANFGFRFVIFDHHAIETTAHVKIAALTGVEIPIMASLRYIYTF